MKKNILKNNNGYTLLFAVLVSSIVLAVGISILTISKKEFLLSSSARESIIAFYAADSGLECAMYNTPDESAFSSSSPSTATANCFNTTLSNPNEVPAIPASPFSYQYTNNAQGIGAIFTFHIKTSSSACAVVSINKFYNKDLATGEVIPITDIISKGYNLGWNNSAGTCTDSSPKRVERAIERVF